MVVCKFFLQGNCRFGANCRNEHPEGQGGNAGGFGSQNRFGALSNTGTNRFGGQNDNSKPYNLNPSDIRQDLTRGQGRPQWVLSTYGAGRGTPASLFEGNEFSPEEIRVRFYEMAAKGQEAQADQEAIQLWTKAEQELDTAANNIDEVARFMEEAENKHPNRYDFLKVDGSKTREEVAKAAETSNTASSGFGTSSAFGQSPNNSNPFAKPAAATFGQPSGPSAFGGSTFGKPAQPSGFGQPAFGQSGFGSTGSGFGQSNSPFAQTNNSDAFDKTAFGGPFGSSAQTSSGQSAQAVSSSPFGQQSPFTQSTSTPSFGQTGFGQPAKPNPFAPVAAGSGFGSSGFGQTTQAAPAFGQPSQPTSAFGQPSQPTSAFGQPSQPTSAFGQPSQSTSTFGQTSQPSSGFGQSGFGQPAQPNAFGKPAFGQPAASSPFGQTPSTSSGFGTTPAFGATSGFGMTSQHSTSPFAKDPESKIAEISMDSDAHSNVPAQTMAPSNPFGATQPQAPAAQPIPATSASVSAPTPAQPSNATSQDPHVLTSKLPRPLHYTQTLPLVPSQMTMTNKLSTYRGQRVEYLGDEPDSQVPCYNRPDKRGPEKIWFPDAGATTEVATLNKEDKIGDLQAAAESYIDQIKAEYAYLFEEGRFKDGKVPAVPPMREWCVYDF